MTKIWINLFQKLDVNNLCFLELMISQIWSAACHEDSYHRDKN